MAFPKQGRKSGQSARVNPEDQLAYLVQRGRGIEHPPDLGMILFYQSGVLKKILQRVQTEVKDRFRPRLHMLKTDKGTIGLMSDFGFGGPAAVITLELLIAAGVRRFFFIGSAGALQENLSAGQIILAEDAIRDEGVSYHYLDADEEAKASPSLLRAWRDTLETDTVEPLIATTWSIDAPFRETRDEVQLYRSQNVACVEMEAASVYAVGQYRGVEVASGFAISDSLVEEEWKPQFHYAATLDAQVHLFEAAVQVLQE